MQGSESIVVSFLGKTHIFATIDSDPKPHQYSRKDAKRVMINNLNNTQ